MKRKVIVIVALLVASMSLLIAAAALYSRGAATVPADTAEPAMNAETTPDPEEQARQEALTAKRADALSRAQTLAQQYFYDEAIAALSDAELECDEIAAARAELENEKAALVDYTDDIPHIFLHSLIVYPEMIFTDLATPMGGYNSGFSEKAEFEKILPQLYERGYVLYDLDKLWVKQDGKMVRQKIMLPEGKTPLILSVDDVAYAYGDGYAQQLFVDDSGELMYRVNNPYGGVDIIPDGDVMGVVDAFVAEHPDFSYQGHKGTIALTGFQGAFGYDYDIPEQADQMRVVVAALKEAGTSPATAIRTTASTISTAPAARWKRYPTISTNGWITSCPASARRGCSSHPSATACSSPRCNVSSTRALKFTAPLTARSTTS